MDNSMATYSADEDMALLLLVVAFEDSNGVIDWDQVSEHMAPTTKTTEDFQQRLQHLKIEDTTILRSLPPSYLAGSTLKGASTNRSIHEIYEAIEEIFGHLTKADVRQPSGDRHLNHGEIAPVGVTAIVQHIDLTEADVFLDIGSGTGSVLAQVVLQTPVRNAIGLEISDDLAQKSRDAIQASKLKYPRLHMVTVITGDVKDLPHTVQQVLSSATVIYSNNLVFGAKDNLALRKFVCKYHPVRLVLLSERFCARCSSSCTDEFCTLWKEIKVIEVKACWTDQPSNLYMYRKKVSDLLSIIQNM
jgi:hypothetical protein